MTLRRDKKKKFCEFVIQEYNKNKTLDRFFDIRIVENTDGSFKQIGIRPGLKKEMFVEDNYDVELVGIGKIMDSGERNYLINKITKIMETGGIEKIRIPKREFDHNRLQESLDTLNANIIIPTALIMDILTDEKWQNRISYHKSGIKFNYLYDVLPVPTNVLQNKIIIIDKMGVIIQKLKFHNRYTNSDENIDIKITERYEKVDVTIRSVIKLQLYHKWIKVIDLK